MAFTSFCMGRGCEIVDNHSPSAMNPFLTNVCRFLRSFRFASYMKKEELFLKNILFRKGFTLFFFLNTLLVYHCEMYSNATKLRTEFQKVLKLKTTLLIRNKLNKDEISSFISPPRSSEQESIQNLEVVLVKNFPHTQVVS